MIKKALQLLMFACITMTFTSCLYRSAEEDEVSTNPTTNNPQLNKSAKDDDLMPGIRY